MIKLIAILLLANSCGIKHKVNGTVKLEAPKSIEINVIHTVDPSVFTENCEIKYANVLDSLEKQEKIDKCAEDNAELVNNFIQYLNTPGE